MAEDIQLSRMQMDALQEIGNIGLGHAATSLSELLESRINMDVPRAGFISYEQVIELIGGYEKPVSCVSLSLGGDVKGLVFYIFDETSTLKLLEMLVGLDDHTASGLDSMAMSTIKEIGNIMTGAFVTAIGNFTGLKIKTSVPIFAYDMLAAVFTSLILENGRPEEENILAIETKLFRNDQEVSGYFFLLAEPESISMLFSALGLES